jgi:hypothetical protein
MRVVNRKLLVAGALVAGLTLGSQASAQSVPVPGISAPAFPSSPSPPLQPPPIPQFGVSAPLNVAPPTQNTFSDRATQCLQTGAAAGLTTGSLTAYTGQCVNH